MKEVTIAFYLYLAALPCTNLSQNAIANNTNFTVHKTLCTKGGKMQHRIACSFHTSLHSIAIFCPARPWPRMSEAQQATMGPRSKGWRRLCSPEEVSPRCADLPCGRRWECSVPADHHPHRHPGYPSASSSLSECLSPVTQEL